ncbi:hypothetical protein GCM10022224_062290 [Nonomuraea antimicrobica]|uniref:HTH tetR-type domain-containing protein n=1 Tax=Nonomuraea antimicrobica TaxID=561173 RepID=A0ABP7CDQ6_9ACTN
MRLVDEGGIEGLSMRKLAAELDVNPMSLYHHVESKEALLGLICHGAAEGMALPPDDGSPWEHQLRELALAYHRHVKAHPAMWAYLHNHPEAIADREMPIWQALYRVLRLAGVPESELWRTGDVLHAFVSGFVMAETLGHLPGDGREIERDFDTAIRLMTHGLSGLSG